MISTASLLAIWLVPVMPMAILWKLYVDSDDNSIDIVACSVLWPLLLVVSLGGGLALASIYLPFYLIGKLVDGVVTAIKRIEKDKP